MAYKLGQAMRDGASKSPFYTLSNGVAVADAQAGAVVSIHDEPALPFSDPYQGSKLPKGVPLTLTEIIDDKTFWTWLVVYPSGEKIKPNDTPAHVLYHINWKVHFTGKFENGQLTGGSTSILTEGKGEGQSKPTLGKEVEENDAEFVRDQIVTQGIGSRSQPKQ